MIPIEDLTDVTLKLLKMMKMMMMMMKIKFTLTVFPHLISLLKMVVDQWSGNICIIKQIEIMDADTSQIKIFCQVF